MTISLPQNAVVPIGKVAATAIAWRFKGELRVTAIVKATFTFAPDAAMARAEPQPIFEAEVHHGRNPVNSIRFTTDLVPYRKRADVTFTGYAHAPPGGAESMTVRLAILDGSRPLLDKALLVRQEGGFDKIPITYERAFGGIGFPDNPFGEGFQDEGGHEEPGVLDPVDPKRVAGLAPIPQTLLPRRRLLGTARCPSFGRHAEELPSDLDFDFFQAAPADQRIDFLRGDEQILLEGLHPALRTLRTRLPGARGVARIHGLSAFGVQEGRQLAMSADALHVSGDEQRCTVTWRGSFPVAGEAALAAVRIAAGVEHPGAPVVWPDPAELARAAASVAARAPAPAPSTGDTLPLSDGDIEIISGIDVAIPPGLVAGAPRLGAQDEHPLAGTVVLPDRPTELLPPERPTEPWTGPPAGAPRGARAARGAPEHTLPVPSRGGAPRAPALPFQPASAAGASPAPPRNESNEPPAQRHSGAGETLPIASRALREAPAPIPFRREGESAPPEAPVPPAEAHADAPPEAPPAAAAAAPPAPAPAESAKPAAAGRASPWAEPPPAARPAAKRPSPKVDVRSKLYKPDKKGR